MHAFDNFDLSIKYGNLLNHIPELPFDTQSQLKEFDM